MGKGQACPHQKSSETLGLRTWVQRIAFFQNIKFVTRLNCYIRFLSICWLAGLEMGVWSFNKKSTVAMLHNVTHLMAYVSVGKYLIGFYNTLILLNLYYSLSDINKKSFLTHRLAQKWLSYNEHTSLKVIFIVWILNTLRFPSPSDLPFCRHIC